MNRTLLFLTFFGTILTLFGLMQWRLYRLYRSWVERSVEQEKRRRWMLAARWTVGAGIVGFFSRFLFNELGSYDHWAVQALVIYPGGIFFGAVVLGFLAASVRDLALLVMRLVEKLKELVAGLLGASAPDPIPIPVDHGRRRLLRTGGLAMMATIGGIPTIASAATARDYQINRIPLYFDNLPSGLEGFTLAQISDLHSGVFMTEGDMEGIFELVNGLHPQLTLLTGDQVDNTDSQIPPLHRALRTLKADYGVFGVLGNHDHYATAERVAAAMRDRGVTVLSNEHQTLKIDGEDLSIVGIDDAGNGARNYADLDAATAGLTPDGFRIFLSHRPDTFDVARQKGMHLSLAGHTHGGQVGIEFGGIKLNPVYLIYKYARGLYQEAGKYLYVNVGVGMVGVPIRLIRPEIALFTLRRRPAVAAAA